MNEKPSKFAALLKNRQADGQEATVPESVSPKTARTRKPAAKPAPPERKAAGRPGGAGKSSNPDYVQVTAYVPEALYKDVRINLLRQGETKDFSELVAELLQVWNSKQSKP